jgi:hypothetical protein
LSSVWVLAIVVLSGIGILFDESDTVGCCWKVGEAVVIAVREEEEVVGEWDTPLIS